MSAAIEISGVGKRYRRPRAEGGSLMLSHTMLRRAAFWRQRPHVHNETFWALSDVSFKVDEGEIVGLIGRNGSGKSTLLKIISQITAPTTGEIRLRGRTGTLLEVGTGFHPELSGRDNVYLNGAMLGMRRAEIARKFEEIVEFSGVGAFIDMPVKRYSSGMQTRLAFSVAAHLEAEILIVDEVLAVGDADFQKKCLGKMGEVSRSGRTVLFVSHNMAAVDELCTRAIWLDGGTLIEDSRDTYEVTSKYLFGSQEKGLAGEIGQLDSSPLDNDCFALRRLRVRGEDGLTITRAIRNDSVITVEIEFELRRADPSLSFGYAITNEAGETVYWSMMTDADDGIASGWSQGPHILYSQIPRRFLNQGLYRIELIAVLRQSYWFSGPGVTPYAVFLRVQGGLSDSVHWVDPRPGLVAPVMQWHCSSVRK